MKDSLLLEQDTWDLCLNIQGDIAMGSAPYSIAQDVASSVRVFLGDLWYDQAAGIPYLTRVLGQVPDMPFLRSQVEQAALLVEGVVTARCLLVELTKERVLRGQVQFIDTDGTSRNVTF